MSSSVMLHRQLGLSYRKWFTLRRLSSQSGSRDGNRHLDEGCARDEEVGEEAEEGGGEATATRARHVDDNTPVNTSQITTFLEDNGMVFEEGYTGFTTTCLRLMKSHMRLEDKKNAWGNLYINKNSGWFDCKTCGKAGSWPHFQQNTETFRAALNNGTQLPGSCFWKQRIPAAEKHPVEVTNHLAACQPISCLDEAQLKQLLGKLEMQTLTRETLEFFGAVVPKDETDSLVIPVTGTSGNPVGYVTYTREAHEVKGHHRGHRVKERYKGSKESILGLRTLSGAYASGTREFVLVEDERDALAMWQATRLPVLAARKKQVPQQILPLLERFDRFTLWPRHDVSDSSVYARKLAERRCYVVRRSKKDPSPLKALDKGETLSTVLSQARLAANGFIVTFSDLREQVHADLLNSDMLAGVQWKRYPKLNEILKGHRRGELTIFTGPTGSGKTTFISEYSLDLCESGVNTLWGSFEISNKRLMRTMLRQHSRLNVERHMELFDSLADSFEALNMSFMTFHGQESIKRVIETMSHAVYVKDISHVIVDNLQFMMGSHQSAENRFLLQDSIISEFRNFATMLDCHVTLVVHPRKERAEDALTLQSIFGSGKASQEADNVMILQRKELNSGSAVKYIEVLKNRCVGDLGKIRLQFDRESLTFPNGLAALDWVLKNRYVGDLGKIRLQFDREALTFSNLEPRSQKTGSDTTDSEVTDPGMTRETGDTAGHSESLNSSTDTKSDYITVGKGRCD